MPSSNSEVRVALVHDYLREYGGAERVVEALHEIYPDAPLYTAFVDSEAMGIHWSRFKDWDIRQSWLQKVPLHSKLFSPLRIFAPNYFESFDLNDFDLVISSSNAYFAKAVKVRKNDPKGRPDAHHLCYCHTPARSLYGYSTMTDWESKPVTKVVGTLINHYLRVIDFKVAQKVDQFIANSAEVQRRIKKFYRRDSVIIYPPVKVPAWKDVLAWKKAGNSVKTGASKSGQAPDQGYFLYVNRLAFAKHPEMAVEACSRLNLPLKVVGDGKMLPKLKEMAGPNTEFMGAVMDDELHKLYSGAVALLYPVEDEDFGIVPVEAMGHGLPVLAHRSGGPRETVVEGKTGLFFDELSTEGLIGAIEKFQKTTFSPDKIHEHAEQFSEAKFKERIVNLVKSYNT